MAKGTKNVSAPDKAEGKVEDKTEDKIEDKAGDQQLSDPDETIKIAPPADPVVPPDAPFHNPSTSELDKFAPPPPLPPLPAGVTESAVDAQDAAPIEAHPRQLVHGDRTTMLGLTLQHEVPAPNIVASEPVEAPILPPRYSHLPKKTQMELRRGWLHTHSSMDGFFIENSQPMPPEPEAPPPPPELDPRVDYDKLPLRTKLELEAGAKRLHRAQTDYQAVLDQVARNDAARLQEGEKPKAGDMDYAAPKR